MPVTLVLSTNAGKEHQFRTHSRHSDPRGPGKVAIGKVQRSNTVQNLIQGPEGPLDFSAASAVRDVLAEQLGRPFVVVQHESGFAVRMAPPAQEAPPETRQYLEDQAAPPIVLRPAPRAMWHMYPLAALGLFILITSGISPIHQILSSYFPADWAMVLAASGVALILYALFRVYLPVILHRYTVTDDAVEAVHGIIKRDTTRVRLEHLRSVGMRQSIPDRLLNVGDLDFYSAGTGTVDVVFADIRAPVRIKAEIHRRIENVARRSRSDD